MTPEGQLSELLEEVFSDGTMQRFIADEFGFQASINWDQPLADEAQDVARHLLAEKLVAPFLERMAENKPGRADEIEAVASSLASDGRAEHPAITPFMPATPTGAYHTVELEFSTTDQGYAVTDSADDESRPRPFDLAPVDPGTLSVPGTPREASSTGRADGPTIDPDQLSRTGRALWDVVFSADGLGLAGDLPPIDPQAGGRRLVVDLSRSPELARYPWEYLEEPGRTPFGADVKSTVVRKIDQGRFVPARLGIDRPPLRLLIATAQSTTGGIDMGAELARIEASGLRIEDRIEQATYGELFKALRDSKPDVLHFIGHGTSEGIELQGDDATTRLLSSADLAGLVGNQLQNLRLVFLNSCLGANEADPHAFTGAASQMVAAGLPAAIAMQYPISDDAAVELAEIFYRGVADGEDIDVALTHARSFLKGQPRPEWGAPTLYVRDWTGRLALVDATATAAAPPAEVMAADVTAPATAASPPASPPPPSAPPTVTDPIGPAVPMTVESAGPRAGRWLVAAAVVLLGLIGVVGYQALNSGAGGDNSEVAGPTPDNDSSEEVDQPPSSSSSDSSGTTTSDNSGSTTTDGSTTEGTTTTTEGTTTTEPEDGVDVDGSTGETDPDVVLDPPVAAAVDDGEIAVVNGTDDAVDLYIDGELVAAAVPAGSAASVPAPPPGAREIVIHPATDSPPASVDDRDETTLAASTIAAGPEPASLTIEQGPVGSGEATITLATDDVGPVTAGSGRVVVRDLVGVGAGQIGLTVGDRPVGATVDQGQLSFEAPAGPAVLVVTRDDGPRVEVPLTIDDGTGLFVSLATGSEPGSLEVVVHTRTGLASHPTEVPTGNSGLRSMVGSRLLSPPGPTATARTVGTTGSSATKPTSDADPVGITATVIGLDAVIEPVGVAADARMEVPRADRVGWYRHGATPGRAGATVLAAHVDWNGRPGAFLDLTELEPGDRIDVSMSDGSTVSHVVVDRATHRRGDLPVDELYRPTGASTLHLITCGGPFDHERGTYQENVVVTAVPIAHLHPMTN